MKKMILLVVLSLPVVSLGHAETLDTAHYVGLSWNAPKPERGETVVAYRVYRNQWSCQGPWYRRGRSTQAQFSDAQVVAGDSYFYHVTALDQHGRESKASNCRKAAIP